jgi:MFS family permease
MTEKPRKNSNNTVTIAVSPQARKALIVLCSATILTLYLHTALAPALPNIIQSFNISIDLASWVLTAYMVTGAVLSIVIGRLADLYGAKKMFLIVMICYSVGISLAPFSQDINSLLALRVLQGVGVAVIPLGSKIIRDVYPDEKYIQAQVILTSMFSVGSVVGLVIGAFVIQFFNWHGLFFTALPFSVIVIRSLA